MTGEAEKVKEDSAAVLFLRTGRQVLLSCGRASAKPFCKEAGERAYNRPGMGHGLMGAWSPLTQPGRHRSTTVVPTAAPLLP